MKPTFKAFHGSKKIKEKFIARMKAHMNADELIQGSGWTGKKGCAVGCTLDNYSHFAYEAELGIPFTIAILEDNIFESLSKKESATFPLEFLKAVPVGVDLSLVYNKLEIWVLLDKKHGIINKMKTDEEKKVCTDLADLHKKIIEGKPTTEDEWKAVKDMAYMADMAYRADIAYMADMAYRADMAYMADMAYRADIAYRAYIAYRADRAYMADDMRKEFIRLIKATK